MVEKSVVEKSGFYFYQESPATPAALETRLVIAREASNLYSFYP